MSPLFDLLKEGSEQQQRFNALQQLGESILTYLSKSLAPVQLSSPSQPDPVTAALTVILRFATSSNANEIHLKVDFHQRVVKSTSTVSGRQSEERCLHKLGMRFTQAPLFSTQYCGSSLITQPSGAAIPPTGTQTAPEPRSLYTGCPLYIST
ncbi:hypothetical protein Anapl_09608 [Anas platyrhynchos]|uniref:Uncharacterized protein n=1 Tax=Anas platyrhynchos TaxID=8839 RepID=R0K1T5_ANAPL|nr:hypothetical protein Anapl_09608 [Anas platyrhynchos]